MELSITRKSPLITCKPEALESYWLKSVLEFGNNSLAKLMGVHPSTLSRDKNRIAKLASQLVYILGLPDGSFSPPGCEQNVVITGEEAKKLLSMLENIREQK